MTISLIYRTSTGIQLVARLQTRFTKSSMTSTWRIIGSFQKRAREELKTTEGRLQTATGCIRSQIANGMRIGLDKEMRTMFSRVILVALVRTLPMFTLMQTSYRGMHRTKWALCGSSSSQACRSTRNTRGLAAIFKSRSSLKDPV